MAFTQSSDKLGSCSSLVDLVVLNYHSWFPTTKVTSDGKHVFSTKPQSSWLRKKCAKLQRLVVQSGPESVYNMFKMLQVCHSYQPPGNGSICVAPPYSHHNPHALGAFPRDVQWRPPTKQTIVAQSFDKGMSPIPGYHTVLPRYTGTSP